MIAQDRIREFAARIAAEYQPQRVILFGSQARGDVRADSDVDVLVLMSYRGSASRKAVEILTRLDPGFPIDLIVRDPETAARRYAEHDPLMREAFDLGVVLYDRDGAGVAA
jgi:predicted nucleotidyltransferase